MNEIKQKVEELEEVYNKNEIYVKNNITATFRRLRRNKNGRIRRITKTKRRNMVFIL